MHAAVAQSTFRSQNAKNTILGFGALLEVEMLKKMHEAHVEEEMKTRGGPENPKAKRQQAASKSD